MSALKPILFTGDMVCAILDGRKVVTRRLAKERHFPPRLHERALAVGVDKSFEEFKPVSPFGAVGGRLYVRESFRVLNEYDDPDPFGLLYVADGEQRRIRSRWQESAADIDRKHGETTRPSILMPRWASRIHLEITSFGIDRVRRISESEAVDEGFASREAFAEAIRGMYPGAWEGNAWVWTIGFTRIEESWTLNVGEKS